MHSSIVVLTGAGVSAESGLKTFRDNDGLWENHSVHDVCTPEAFAKDPELVHRFYNQRRQQLASVRPNAAHISLAKFQQSFPGEFTLITQNVDHLHELAGSTNVVHMHGELLKARCVKSGQIFSWHSEMYTHTPCPCCEKSGNLRPHIVWFGEIPLHMEKIEASLERCDLFVAIGTSGHVYPAAGFVRIARACGAKCVELNLEPSAVHRHFDIQKSGPASRLVGEFFQQLI